MHDVEFSDDLIQQVWERGRAIAGHDPTHWRQDRCGAWMHRGGYGFTSSEFGWKIERTAIHGPDETEHLQPFHHANEFDIGAGVAHCRVTADRRHLAATEHAVEPRNRTH